MLLFFFFFNDTATTEIYTLSLHDALPISGGGGAAASRDAGVDRPAVFRDAGADDRSRPPIRRPRRHHGPIDTRSEEHTSELQSHLNLVCRLLLEKKKKKKTKMSVIQECAM